QEGPSERVEVRGGRRRGVLCGEPRGACVRRAGFRTRGRRRAAVDVPLALEYGVVLVPVLLLPGVEFDFGERAVGEVSADQAIERVVTKDGSDAGLDDLGFALEGARGAEIRLVLFDRVALVVEQGAARADPAWVDGAGQTGDFAGFGLDFGSYDAAEAVGVGEGFLDAGVGVDAGMLLTREGVGERGFAALFECEQVVDEPGRGVGERVAFV